MKFSYKILLAMLAIFSSAAVQALEPYDAGKATPWLGVQTIDAEKAGIGKRIENIPFYELNGRRSSLHEIAGKRGTVVVVRDPECPVSIRYGPRVVAMAKNYAARGFNFVFIYLNESLAADELDKDAGNLNVSAYKIGKGSFALAHELGVKSTGEVFVLDEEQRVVYRGAIDDQYGFGYTQDAPTYNYLRNALEAELKHWSIAVPATLAPGCAIDADPNKDDFLPIPHDAALS